MYWRVGWCTGLTCSCLHCFAQCNFCGPIVAFGYKKEQEKKRYMCYIFNAGWKPSFCCSSRVKCKTHYHLNRGMIQYIPVKQAL